MKPFFRCATVGLFLMSALSFAMAQQPAGTLRGWGSNGNGELADGLTGDSSVPQPVQNLTDVIAVADGAQDSFGGYTLAVKSDGSVWAWGNNHFGQLGNPNVPTASPVPVPVTGFGSGSGVIAVAAGSGHSLALKADGSVWAWGLNGNGQLGNGGPNAQINMVPTQVVGLGSGSGVIAIAAGIADSMALKSDGSVLFWGLTGSTTPVVVSGLGSGSGVIAIAAGGNHNLALKADGSVAAWGSNTEGQLGIGTLSTGSLTPVGVSGLGIGAGVIAIAAGFEHSLALKSDGSVLAWGLNQNGELGNGDATGANQPAPVAVTGFGTGSGVIAIAGGKLHSLALKSDGTEWAWGDNEFGQLGIGGVIDVQGPPVTTPVQVSNLNGAVTIALGPNASHSLAIVQPLASLSTTSLSFGDQPVGSLSASQMITIQNNSQDPLVIDSLSLSGAAAGDFKVSAPSTPFTVSPGASNVFSVAFDPITGFARLATLLINGNAFAAPQAVALSGNGLVQADIAVGLSASPTSVHDKKDLTYTVSVQNDGPTSAPAVVMNDALPAGTVFVSGKTSQGNCVASAPGATGIVTCNLGTLNSGTAATITLVVAVQAPGGSTLVNTVSATAGAPDPNLGNNSAVVVTSVVGSRH
jgi:uncharacterized repeat protein (TIGR01451 family)